MPYPITKVLEEICKLEGTHWTRQFDSSVVIQYRDRVFRIRPHVHEDTGTALLTISEDKPVVESEE